MAFTFRPPTLWKLPPDKLALELDRHLPRLYDAHNALNGQAVKGPVLNGGFAVQKGNEIVTGSKLSIPTGLVTVDQVTVTLSTGAQPHNFTVSAAPSAETQGAIDIWVFQPTSSGNNTPVPCTTAVLARWWATGSGQANT
jgi:hypothetical protein